MYKHMLLAAVLALPLVSHAQTLADWNTRAGVGVGYGAAFPGSGEAKTRALPIIDAEHKNGKLFISTRRGIGYHLLATDTAKVGVAVAYVPGRDAGDDDRLRGFDDINAAAGARVFGEYRVHPVVTLNGQVQQELGGAGGTTATVGAGTMLPVEDALRLRAGLNTTYASSKHMHEWYGVTSSQSASSGLTRYRAESGLRDVTANVGADYDLTDRLTATVGGSLGYLLGDAADSPISDDNVVPGVMAGLSWKF